MNNSKNVLYVTESYTPHDRRFLKAIGPHSGKIWFANLNHAQPMTQSPLPDRFSLWPGMNKPVSMWQELIDRHDVNVIHAGPMDTVLHKIAGEVDCAVVGMSWGSDVLLHAAESLHERERLLKALAKVDALIVDSSAVITQLRQWVPDLNVPCIQFPWGIELERFRDLPNEQSRALRQGLGWTNKTVLISTRSWSASYGIPTLIEAVGLIVSRQPDVRLLLLGDGVLREAIHAQICRLGLEKIVHCPGFVREEDLPSWYCASDYYVSSCLCDGTSVSLLEAMICGLPVIAHRGYGNLEWVTDGENGWLVDCRKAENICDSISRAAEQKNRLEAIGRNNREKIMRLADWKSNSLNIIKAYDLAFERYSARKSAYVE